MSPERPDELDPNGSEAYQSPETEGIVETREVLEMKERLRKTAAKIVEIYEWVPKMDRRHDIGGAIGDALVPIPGGADAASFAIAMKYWASQAHEIGVSVNPVESKVAARIAKIQGIDAALPAATEWTVEGLGTLAGSGVPILGNAAGFLLSQPVSAAASYAVDRSFRANELSAMVFAEHLRDVMDEARAMGIDPFTIEGVLEAQEKVVELRNVRRKRMFGLLKKPQQWMETTLAGHDPDTWHEPRAHTELENGPVIEGSWEAEED